MKGPQIGAQIAAVYAAALGTDVDHARRKRRCRSSGSATPVRAPASARASIDFLEPRDPALAALTRRVKASFDPQRMLGPGRMYAGVCPEPAAPA